MNYLEKCANLNTPAMEWTEENGAELQWKGRLLRGSPKDVRDTQGEIVELQQRVAWLETELEQYSEYTANFFRRILR